MPLYGSIYIVIVVCGFSYWQVFSVQLDAGVICRGSDKSAGFADVPYIRGVTEHIKRILASHNVKVAQKPFLPLG